MRSSCRIDRYIQEVGDSRLQPPGICFNAWLLIAEGAVHDICTYRVGTEGDLEAL